MGFVIVKEALSKAYIEDRISSKLIVKIDSLSITLDFIYDFIDKGDYSSDINLYEHIANLLNSLNFGDCEEFSEKLKNILSLTNMYNKSDITIYELINEFNYIFNTNIVKVNEEFKLLDDYIDRNILLDKKVDRSLNNISDVLGISKCNIINNILNWSINNVSTVSLDMFKGMLNFKGNENDRNIIIERIKNLT